ncbi:MAG: TolC family protein, partial [Bacteroidetes bacterium QS_1_63_11]
MSHLTFVRSLVAAIVVGVLLGAGGDVVAQSVGTTTADTVEVSLEETLVRALEESPEVDQRRAQEQFATARRDEARANRFLTNVSLDVASSFAP